MGEILVIVGFGLTLLCSLWFIIRVFKNSVLWGIACLITGFAMLVPLFLYWNEVKEPFFWMLGGTVILVIGSLMSPQAALLKALFAG